MKWFILFVGLVVVCFSLALVLGLIGGGMSRGTSSLSHEPLPDDELNDADFDELHFDVGLRGYRMSEVDGVIDRLRRELREKDEHLAVLLGSPPPSAPQQMIEPAPPSATEAYTESPIEQTGSLPEPTERPPHYEPHG